MINIRQGRQTAAMALLAAVLALFASVSGVLNAQIYAEPFAAGALSRFLLTGSLAQDHVSIVLGILLAVFSAYLRTLRGNDSAA